MLCLSIPVQNFVAIGPQTTKIIGGGGQHPPPQPCQKKPSPIRVKTVLWGGLACIGFSDFVFCLGGGRLYILDSYLTRFYNLYRFLTQFLQNEITVFCIGIN